MTYELRFSELARNDLSSLQEWIEPRGGPNVAEAYIDRIITRCEKLVDFPGQGTPRDDLLTGARTVSFERRVVIFYRTEGSVIRILRVLDGARRFEGLIN